MKRLKTELMCWQWKDWKVILIAGNPLADAELTEKTNTELTEKNWNWTFVQAIHQQMLNLLGRLKLNLLKKNLKLNFCAGNPPADAEPAERYGLPPEFSSAEPSP